MKNVYLLNFMAKFLSIFLIFIVVFGVLCINAPKVQATTTYTQTLKSGINAFPESYQVLLKKLINETDHTNWNFQAYYTGIDWNDFITAQASHGKNRIHTSFDTIYRDSCNNLESEFYCADKDITAYFIDPRNFITERNMFQFLEISYNKELYTKSIIQEMIKGYKVFNNGNSITFKMSDENHKDYGKNVTMTFADIIMVAAEKSQMSPISIVTKIVQEVGSDGSGSTSGKNSTYPNCYNYFNIGAYDSGDAILNGLKHASKAGWNCPYTSIVEGAIYNSKNYIQAGQNTLYFYKFDCVGTKILKENETVKISSDNLYHQYMTNVYDPYSQSAAYYSTYTNNGLLDKQLNFIIPVFDNMPSYVEKPSTLLASNKGQDFYYADITSTLSTRTGPGFNYNYTNITLYKDDLVIMLDRKCAYSGGAYWDRVQFWNGKIGYVASEYLEKYETPGTGGTEEPEPPIEIPKNIIGYGYADVSTTLNVRQGAGSTYKVVTSLTSNEEFKILEDISGWYKIITSKDIIGYVSKEYAVKIEYAKIEGNNIKLIPAVNAEVLANFLNVDSYTVKKGSTTITNGILGTGYKFITNNKEYTIIKIGDVNGDGKTNTGDAFLIQKHSIKLSELKNEFLTAADLNYDGKANTGDAFLTQKYVIKSRPVTL